MRERGAAGEAAAVGHSALTDAMHLAAARCGRLSDEQVRQMRRRRRTAVAAGASAVAVAGLLIVAAPLLPSASVPPTPTVRLLATRPGQQVVATLGDGSTVRLNGATRIAVEVDDGRRSARLLAGQAFFDVRHDPARPFTVRAGSARVRVLGTAFDVDLTHRQVSLSVYRGAVGFDPVAAPRGVVVRAGYRSRFTGGAVETPTPFDPKLPDWRQGWVDTAGMRLGDLVEVLDRQGGTPIVAPAEPLASTMISGRFRTDQPRRLLAAIGEGFGFTVVDQRDRMVLRPVQ